MQDLYHYPQDSGLERNMALDDAQSKGLVCVQAVSCRVALQGFRVEGLDWGVNGQTILRFVLNRSAKNNYEGTTTL